MAPDLRGHHPLSPLTEPSSPANSTQQAHTDLYERTQDPQPPLFPNSPPLEEERQNGAAEMQRSWSQPARLTDIGNYDAASLSSAASQRGLQLVTTGMQRAPTPSSVRSRATSPLASPSAPTAFASFPDPFASSSPPASLPARLSFPSAPHLLPTSTLDPLPVSHLVALAQALSRDLDKTQASLRSQRAELAALERLVRDKGGASEGEIERVKVRARTGAEEVEQAESGGGGAAAGKRTASGGKAPEEWSIDLPGVESVQEEAEQVILPPPVTEVDLDIDDLTEAISSNAFDLGLTPVLPTLKAAAVDDDTASIRSRALSLPIVPEGSSTTDPSEPDTTSAATGHISSVSSAPTSNEKAVPTAIGSKAINRPRHASLSARFVGYIAGAPLSTSPTASGSSVVSPKKGSESVGGTGPANGKRARSGSIRSVNSVASSITSGGGAATNERKSLAESSSWLGGWRWGKSAGGASSLKEETSGAGVKEEEEEGRGGTGAGEATAEASGQEDVQEDVTTPLAAPGDETRALSKPLVDPPMTATSDAADETLQPFQSRSRSRSSSSSSTSPTESGERSRPSSRRTSRTAQSTLDTTLPGSPPLSGVATTTSPEVRALKSPQQQDRLLSPPESPTLTRRRSSAPPPNMRQAAQQSTAAAVLSTPLTASTISLPTASPNRLTGYGSSGPTSPARSPSSNPLALPELPDSPTTDLSPARSREAADARHRFVPGVPLYSALDGNARPSSVPTTASDRLVASAKGTINRAFGGLRPTVSAPGFSRTSSHSSQSTSSAEAFNGLLNHLPAKLPPLSLARYSPFSQPALSMPATHVSLSASTASLAAPSAAGPAGSPLVAHTAVLAPASAATGAQTMELDTISAEAAPPSLALLKPSYQSAAAAAGVGDSFDDEDGPMIDRFGFIYDVHTGMALLKESRRRKAGERPAKEDDVAPAADQQPTTQNQLEVPSAIPAVMTTPQTELEVHPQLDALREAIGLTPTVEAENALSPRVSANELTAVESPPPLPLSGDAPSDDRPTKLVLAPSSTATSRRASPVPPSAGTGPQSMRALLVQLRTMTDALEQTQQSAWDSFIRRRQRKLAKLKQAQLDDQEDKAPAAAAAAEREREMRRKSVFLAAEEVENDSIEQDVWTSENLVGVAQMGTEKKGKKEDWNEFKDLVRKGIPIAYRPKIWGECSSANEAREPGVYQELLAQPTTDDEAPCLKQIDMDCHRTFPTNVFFAGNGPGVTKLRNVLVAYSRRDPKVGYCQGMNNLVATLLLTHPAEEDAFWVLVCIIENILPSDYYTSHLLVSRADQQVLKDLVDRTLPKLSAHLEEQGVELSAITFGWFLSLFTDCLPIQTLLRVWDLFFIHGTIFLFRIALAILKLHETELLECDSAAGLYAMLGQLPAGLWNADRLLKVACDELASAVKDRDVASLRNRHVTALEAEMGLGGDDL
ncbi:hypothetical protein JCM10908_005660 [Rhodotorula pacifica]|uniref:uncharacterized protein n=1 Tax=Rhodotorula pacifica TaxID=1495444 RepID=UPI003177EE4F